jgi:ketosteroid isomerase-like protein
MGVKDNVRVVQKAYKAVAARDIRALLKLMASDVVWRLPDMRDMRAVCG